MSLPSTSRIMKSTSHPYSSEHDVHSTSKAYKPSGDDTPFRGGRELWLARRLMDPEIYRPLQASKETLAPDGAQYPTKAAIYRRIASEFNQQTEHAGFRVDAGKIKNKITKMSLQFKLAHRLRNSSSFSTEDDMRDAVKDKCRHYFILEPKWAHAWSDGLVARADSIITPDDEAIREDAHVGNSIQGHSDGSTMDDRDDVLTEPESDQESMIISANADSPNAKNIKDGEDGDRLQVQDGNARRRPKIPATISASGSQPRNMSLMDKDDQTITNKKPKDSQRVSSSDVLTILSDLFRYEIDSRKEISLNRHEIDARKERELAEIELRKTIHLAKINTYQHHWTRFRRKRQNLLRI